MVSCIVFTLGPQPRMSNEFGGFSLRPLQLKKQVLDTTFWASSISSISFQIFHDLLFVLLELFWYEALTHGTKFIF